jgi:hypothetical protein
MTPTTPQDLFDLGRRNPVVGECLKAWRYGSMTWDQAMMTAVRTLATHVEKLERKAMAQAIHPSAFVNQGAPDCPICKGVGFTGRDGEACACVRMGAGRAPDR